MSNVRHFMTLPKPTSLERVAGSLVSEVGLGALGAITGGVLAPLLPILAKSLASERQRKRIETALTELTSVLEAHDAVLRDLSDEQYKLINETVLTLLQTTQEAKLKYLRAVVENCLTGAQLLPEEASVISRIVRDISAEEIAFLLRAFEYDGVALTEVPQPPEKQEDNILLVDPSSREALAVSGFLSLGLVASGDPTYDLTPLRFTRIVAKLIALLKQNA